MDAKRSYFATRTPDECAAALINKTESWDTTLRGNGFYDKLRNLYLAYHGAYSNSVGEAHQITFSGDDGEIVEIAVNHLRNITRHMLTMTTATRPAVECKAINTDSKSLSQTYLGNGLLDYYFREKRFEEFLEIAVENSLVTSAGWIKMAWNSMLGEVTNKKQIEEAEAMEADGIPTDIPAPIYEGDVEIDVLSGLDVIMDLSKENGKHDWLIARSFKNRYDLIAKYPDLEKEIMAIESKDRSMRIRMGSSVEDETDDIPVYEFYHRRSEALPDGRYMLYVSKDAVLHDGTLPYRRIPLFPILPGRILGTPLGYSPIFDLMPVQDAINSLYSSAVSNNEAFGTQNILNPNGSNIDVSQLSGSLNIIDYNAQAGEPKSLQLTHTPPELYQLIDRLIKEMETLSAINSTARGNPDPNLRSGTALAMVQTNAIQFISGLQKQFIYLIESTGMCLIEMLQEFADSPRIATIVGKSGRTYMKEFKGTDLRSINRVVVDVANPLTKNIAGRVQMADNLLQYGKITPDQYVSIIHTGKLEVGTEGIVKEEFLMRSENEAFLEGRNTPVLLTDNHPAHIMSHKSVLNDPIMRQDPELLQNVLGHIQEHINTWQAADPNILAALGIQPIQAPPQAPPGQAVPPQDMQAPNALSPQDQAIEQEGAQPQQPRLPAGFEGAPLSAEEGFQQQG